MIKGGNVLKYCQKCERTTTHSVIILPLQILKECLECENIHHDRIEELLDKVRKEEDERD